jgi:hypothetical protein
MCHFPIQKNCVDSTVIGFATSCALMKFHPKIWPEVMCTKKVAYTHDTTRAVRVLKW